MQPCEFDYISCAVAHASAIISDNPAVIEDTSGAGKKNKLITSQAKKSIWVGWLHRWCVGCHNGTAVAVYLFPGFLYSQGLFIVAVAKTPDVTELTIRLLVSHCDSFLLWHVNLSISAAQSW